MTRDKLGMALEAIRSAALDPRAWPRVQSTTEVLFDATGSQLAVVDHEDGNRFTSRTSVIPEIDRDMARMAPTSEPVQWSAERPHWRRFVDYDYIDEAGMRRSAFYANNARYDVTYRMGLRLIDQPRKSTAIVWFWPRSAGHVQALQIRLLEAIRQPLMVAAGIAEMAASDVSRHGDILEGLSAPALLTLPDGTFLAANGPGNAALVARDGIELEDGRVVACWRRGRAALARILADAPRDPDPSQPRPAHAILPRPGMHRPAVFAAMPLARRHHFVHGTDTIVLLVMTNAATTAQALPVGVQIP